MATCGEVVDENSSTSDFSPERICQPCSDEGNTLPADSFCSDCLEYFCQRCTQHHRVLRMSRHHTILSLDEVELDLTPRTDKCTVKCSLHRENTIKYYCPCHSYLGCSTCITIAHSNCTNVEYIPEVSKDLSKNEEYRNFYEKLQTLATFSKKTIPEVEEKINLTQSYQLQAEMAVQQFREDFIKALDKLVKQMNAGADSIKQEQIAKLLAISAKCTSILTDIEAIIHQVDKLQTSGRNCDTFVTMKEVGAKLEVLSSSLETAAFDIRVCLYVFQPSTEVQEMLNESRVIGKLCQKEREAEYVTTIDARSKNDTYDCLITGSTMLSNYWMAITDTRNNKLKILDIKANNLISELSLSSPPWDVTRITESQVAVTLPKERKIIYVTTYPKLAIAGEIKVKEACRGVVHRAGRLAVTYFDNSPVVEIMDKRGHVTHRLTSGAKETIIKHCHCAFSNDNKTLYVSNFSNNTVVRLSLEVEATYSDSQLDNPCDILVMDNDTVYICCRDSCNIHLITPDCKKGKLLLTRSDGLAYPRCISVSEAYDMLYVGLENGHIKIFKLTQVV